jgi:hypothetical protein
MKKCTAILFLILFTGVSASSQDSSRFFYESTLSKGVGFTLQDIAYERVSIPTSELLYYSFGAGTALDARLGVRMFSGFSLSADGSYRLIYMSKSENFGRKNKSRATIAQKTAGGSLHYTLRSKTPDLWLTGATFNAGIDHYFPATLKRIKNTETLEDIEYQETTGFHLEAMLTFLLFPDQNIEMLLGIKYHNVSFKADEMPEREEFNTIDGQGIDFSIGIRGSL